MQLWSDDDETDDITPGENVKLKLKGVEEEDILSGFCLCNVENPCSVGRIFDAQVSSTIMYGLCSSYCLINSSDSGCHS